MKTKILSLIALFAFTIFLSAQDARSILDKASETYNNAGGVLVTFRLDTKDEKARNTYSYDGKAYMKGNKFRIDIPDGITWFDGTTQWVYVKETEEVNVSNPTGEELQAISPSAIFGIYKKGFNIAYKGEKNMGGKMVQEVELTPQKKSEFSKIVVQIDKASNIFSRITLVDKAGFENTLTIKSYKTDQSIADSMFSFNKAEYPNAEVVDLR